LLGYKDSFLNCLFNPLSHSPSKLPERGGAGEENGGKGRKILHLFFIKLINNQLTNQKKWFAGKKIPLSG